MQNQEFTELIKNLELIVEKVVAEDKTTFVLKQNVKLSEAFYFLPAGRINKMETGIGATHLELNSLRNSIVVEPLRITAQSKSDQNNNHHHFSATEKKRKEFLKKYLENRDIQYKKILVVIDSLPTLIDALKEFGVAVEDYFLLIDEIDSVQRDSTFRVNMENAIDIYEKFPEDKRALISATLKDFSKPELQNQPLTEFRYENKIKDNVAIKYSNSLKHQLIETLQELLKNTTDKIFVASNDITAAYEVAHDLIKSDFVTQTNISFLLGSDLDNVSLIKEFSNKTIENNKLPTRLNFASSAYFSGYDLLEDYALVVVTNHSQDYSRYSLEEIVQIKGRCRKKLNSIHILASLFEPEDFDVDAPKDIKHMRIYTVEQLEAIAHNQLDMLKCQEAYTVEGDELNEFISQWRDEISTKIEKATNSLVRKNRLGNYEISYLAIDALYQRGQVIKNMYLSKEDFRNNIEQYFNVILEETLYIDSGTENDHDRSKKIIVELFQLLSKSNTRNAFYDSVSSRIKKSKEYKAIVEIMRLGAKLMYTNKSVDEVIIKQKSYKKLLQLKHYLIYMSKPRAKRTIKLFVEMEFFYGAYYPQHVFYKRLSDIAIQLGAYTKSEIAVESESATIPLGKKLKLENFAKLFFTVRFNRKTGTVQITEKSFALVSNKKKQ